MDDREETKSNATPITVGSMDLGALSHKIEPKSGRKFSPIRKEEIDHVLDLKN